MFQRTYLSIFLLQLRDFTRCFNQEKILRKGTEVSLVSVKFRYHILEIAHLHSSLSKLGFMNILFCLSIWGCLDFNCFTSVVSTRGLLLFSSVSKDIVVNRLGAIHDNFIQSISFVNVKNITVRC